MSGRGSVVWVIGCAKSLRDDREPLSVDLAYISFLGEFVVVRLVKFALWRGMGRSSAEVVEGFGAFVAASEVRLRQAFTAMFGPTIGREVTVDVLSFAWEHWQQVEPMENPVGYLFVVGRDRARSEGSDVVTFRLARSVTEWTAARRRFASSSRHWCVWSRGCRFGSGRWRCWCTATSGR